jgi:hypothetical protein
MRDAPRKDLLGIHVVVFPAPDLVQHEKVDIESGGQG